MMGSQPEVTARIDRNELLRLLAATRVAEAAPPVPLRHPRPSSELAALLPPAPPIRRPAPIRHPTPVTGTRVVAAAPQPRQAPPAKIATPPQRASLIRDAPRAIRRLVLSGLC